ncbi:hypothetical protein [Roseofilum sp. Guam]|uniref:hypothetical protein n=1 Tax=Roseofilum sp. Guam TaxID=2821502 RepID=UPI001B292D5D|nr:hypothetical protein [Roseofilum sp. Guam]MBP0027406.1 hypothetical protein [Roseofilum sp. Guam]
MVLFPISEELEKSRDAILYSPDFALLRTILKSHFPNLGDKIFLLHWIPEPDMNFYTLLIDGEYRVEVHLSKEPNVTNPDFFEVTTVMEFLKQKPKMSKRSRREFESAIKLSKTE